MRERRSKEELELVGKLGPDGERRSNGLPVLIGLKEFGSELRELLQYVLSRLDEICRMLS